ncbi:putative TATA element modulatory factor 1, TATA binding protein [Helianthus annuus]|nr:putative TATA element modulatory factor 1, TATA binding protein [Helianthus annuus]
MESIRDSLAEELVKECEKLRSEVSQLPGMKAEMEALRLRHAAALELMGERDEEVHTSGLLKKLLDCKFSSFCYNYNLKDRGRWHRPNLPLTLQ